MKTLNMLMIAAGAAALTAGCATAAGDGATADAVMTEEMVAADDAAWPHAGCLDAAGVRAFVANPANAAQMAYFGFYADGNVIWLGTEHGNRVLSPETPFEIPANGKPYLMRWNIADAPPSGQSIYVNYALDYDAARDGDYAVRAFAINQCITDNLGNYGDCDQPIFGEQAWRDDADFCPPVILSEDPTSVYLYDPNAPRGLPQVYDYSLALVLKAKRPNDPKAGLRLIIDPKVKNGDNNR